MKSIRKRASAKFKKIVFGILALIVLATVSYASIINPLFSHAASLYMTATITDDNGEVDFSPGINNAVANFSYIKTESFGADSRIYNAKISLVGLPVNTTNKTLAVHLPIGMSWVDDASNDKNVTSQLSEAVGVQGVNQSVMGYTFSKSGTRIYHISDSTVSLTLNIKVKADRTVALGYIGQAIKATLSFDGFSESCNVSVNIPEGGPNPGIFPTLNKVRYTAPGEVFSEDEDYIKMIRPSIINTDASYYSQKRLITKVKVSFHVSSDKATLELRNDAISAYSLDSSDSVNGNYVLEYIPDSTLGGYLSLPYVVKFSNDLNANESVIITATGEVSFWQPGGDPVTTQNSSIQTVTYTILPAGEDVTIGWSSLDTSNNGTAHNTSVNTAVTEGENLTGVLGFGYVNNRGATDSADKTIRISFDTSTLGVMGLRLPCAPNKEIETIHIKTVSGIEKDVAVNIKCNAYGSTPGITYANFAIDRDDYIAEISYQMGSIPKATQLRTMDRNDGNISLQFIGRRLDDSKNGTTTVEIYDTSNPDNTTGEATITSKTGSLSGITVSESSNQIKNAGETLNFNYDIYPRVSSTSNPSYRYVTKSPIIYIRSEAKDAAGNFLPLSNIKVTNGASRNNEDITSLFGQISYEDTATARVYMLDGRNINDGSASLSVHAISSSGTVAANQLKLSFSIKTDLTTPDQQYNIRDMVFVQDLSATGSVTTNSSRGNPFNLGEGSDNNTVYAATNNYYQIRGWASIGVENAGRHTSSDTWLTWSEESNPITIGSTEGSLADMKATMINNSGVEVPGPTTIYFPIPKKEQNWGSLSFNNQDFQFSTTLTGAISNPDSSHFTIAYGKNVTPSDNGNSLEAESNKFATNTAGWESTDWEAVNCIKITATNIPANQPGTADNYDFIYKLKVVDSTNASDGAVNTWRPIYYQQLTNSAGDVFAGWYKGSYVSVKLAEGKVSGQIFIDSNENGKKDSNEQDLKEAGWKIELYDKASNRLVRSTMSDANGKYNFIELAMSADGYYINVTNKHPIGGTETAYLFTKKGAASNTGAYNTDNQAEGSISGNPIHGSAYVGPVSPNNTAGEATYNIGVVEYVATNSYSGQVSFSDQNNRFSTRPATVNITATDSDGKTTTISVATDGDGKWTKDLPNYNDRGQKLQYEFSAPDLNNYDMSDWRVSDSEYNVHYAQKTATLTVNHYKKGTTEELAQTESSTVYWGQTYTTTMAEVDSNYEFDSVNGKESDVVSGDVTVTYYYKLKTGTITTHYYIKDTTTSIAPDVVQTKNYTETYTTSPLETIPAAYQNYELVSEHPEGYTGTVSKPSVEVIYYYQKKDPNLSSNISIKAPENVDNKAAKISYEINYDATVKDYIGSISISIIDKLPYPILVDESELDGGVYDAKNQTITWTVNKNHNTYTDGEEITITHNVSLIYDGAKATDSLVNTVEATITLENKDNSAADSAVTTVKTPSKIIYHFVGPDGEEIEREIEDTGFVGDISDITPPEIPGYRLITNVDTVLRFNEEEQVILYRYEKLPEPVSPATGDNIAGYFAVFGTLATILGLVWNRRRRTR